MSLQSDFIESLKAAFKGLKKKTRKIPKEAHDLKEVITLLKEREKHLKEKLEHEHDEEKLRRIKNEIDIIHHQREKGLKLLKELHGGEELPPV